jgi:hypothetical protein
VATRVQLDFENLNLADYDKICEKLNFPSDWPDGLLAHGSAEADGRLRVVDVWESGEHFDRFVESRLHSAIGEALGDRAEPPQRSAVELHTFYTSATP